MAEGPSPPAVPDLPGRARGPEGFILDQLQRTRRHLKAVELAAVMLTLLVASLVYLLAVVLIDHWVVPHGLSIWQRAAAGGILALVGGIYAVRKLLPLVVKRINPVYAAQALEEGRPSLKNSLINFLLLRARWSETPPVIFEAVQRRAATDLSQLNVDSAIDRSKLIKLGYVLVAIVAFAALYKLFSPKDPLRSVGRVVAPWANIAAPTRVRIESIEPGDAQVFHDGRVVVRAMVRGLGDGEPVTLVYSSADGQFVEQPLPMRIPENSYLYTATLPDGSAGLQQDVSYHIVAGDALSPTFRIKVLTPPALLVERVDYAYPQYTELAPRSVEQQGDLQAIEGTQVTIHARANQNIKKAELDYDCDAQGLVPIPSQGRACKTQFSLLLNKAGKPEHASYQIFFENTDGERNPKPVAYQIAVVRDQPPAVAVVEPAADAEREIPLAAGGTLRWVVEASDPDFKLVELTFLARKGAGQPIREALLPEPRAGKFRTTYFFSAAGKKLPLASGDLVECWFEAADNKQPEANRSQTAHFKVRIGSPQPQQDQLADARRQQQQPEKRPEDQPQGDGQQPPPDQPQQEGGEKGQGKQGGQGKGQEQQQGDQGQGDKADGDRGGQQERRPIDPAADPGKAIEEINKQFDDPPQPKQPQQPADRSQQGSQKNEPGNEPPEDQGGKQGGQQGEPGGEGSGGKGGKQQQGSGGKGEQSSQPAAGPQDGQQGGGRGQDRASGRPHEGGNDGDGGEKPAPAERAGEEPGKKGQRSGETRDADPAAGGKMSEGSGENGASGGQKSAERSPSGGEPSSSASDKQRGQGEQGGEMGSGKPQAGKQPGADERGGRQSAGEGNAGAKPTGESADGQGGKPQPSKEAAGGKPGLKPEAGKSGESSEKTEQGNKGEKSGQAQGEKTDGQKGDQAAAAEKRPDGADQKMSEPDGQNDSAGGQGGKTRPGIDRASEPKAGGNEQPMSDSQAKGENPESGQGAAGSGRSNGDEKGTPAPQDQNRARNKKPGEEQKSPGKQKDASESVEGHSPSRSGHESDSKGESSGDQSGGGKQGGGQRGNQAGTGGPGKSTAADEGGAQSKEQGAGDTSGHGGQQQQADRKTGSGNGEEQGPGSKSRAGGEQPGGAKGDGRSGEQEDTEQRSKPQEKQALGPKQTDAEAGNSKPGDQQGSEAMPGEGQKPSSQPAGSQPAERGPSGQEPGQGKNQGSGNPTGGGGLPGGDQAPIVRQPPKAAAPGEDPNLDYARRATDLAIDRLKNQLKKAGGEDGLLEKLNWSRADAERFIKRWEEMKRAAGEPGSAGDAAKARLDDALRNLGLRPKGTNIAGDRAGSDRHRNLREGLRTRPPAEYADQYRAYTTGTSQAKP